MSDENNGVESLSDFLNYGFDVNPRRWGLFSYDEALGLSDASDILRITGKILRERRAT